jgi:hypothetical protein
MSATQTQSTPAHIIIWESKPFNNEVAECDIQSLKDYAEQEKFDLESECRTQYGIPVEWVTREQRSALFSQALTHRRKRLEASGFHHHRCVECGEVSGCLEKDCKKSNATECRVCHKGVSSYQWTMYHRKAAQEGWL